jgi:class 3 adenylate cyclase
VTDRALPTGTLTFFFSDIQGSTRLVQRLGAGYTPVLEEHDRLVRAAIGPAGGVEVRTVGDAFFVVFPTADGAVRAALAAQRALGAARWPDGAGLGVRIGLHTGVGELGGGDYVGIDVHVAARIAAAAHGGQIVVSNVTRALLRDTAGLSLRDLGDHRLKDVGSLRIWQVSADGLPSEFPPLASLEPIMNLPVAATAFIGREREVGEVRALVREHRLVTLTGPGGTGKTRLGVEAARGLGDDVRDGVFFVPLATISDPTLIPTAIATAIALPEDPARPALDVVTAHLRERSALLVLDNFRAARSRRSGRQRAAGGRTEAPLPRELARDPPSLRRAGVSGTGAVGRRRGRALRAASPGCPSDIRHHGRERAGGARDLRAA